MFRMSRTPFAILRPANELAKIAFNGVFDHLTSVQQGPQTAEDRASQFMEVGFEKEFHKDVFHFRRQMDKQEEEEESSSEEDPFTGLKDDSDTDIDTENDSHHLGMIWSGYYVFDLENPPDGPLSGWIIGKGPGDVGPHDRHADLYLCTMEFAKQNVPSLRYRHGRFNFDTGNRAFYMASMVHGASPRLVVNGVSLGRTKHSLNQHSMSIFVDTLQYTFEYTDHALSNEFVQERVDYMVDVIGGPSSVDFDMPTPQRETRTIGQWTIGKSLGKGAIGRVYLASNTRNEMVAVKIMEITRKTKWAVDQEIKAFRQLTELLGDSYFDDNYRKDCIVRLRETTEKFCGNGFDEIGLILEPMTPRTMVDFTQRMQGGYVIFFSTNTKHEECELTF